MRKWFLFLVIPSLLFSQPTPVIIKAPLDSSAGITNPVQFIWTKSPLASSYTIQISTSNAFSSTIINQTIPDTSFSPSSLQLSTRYYWRVRAEDTLGGASAWTNAMFTMKLKVPTLQNPISGSTNVNLKPTLSWSSVFSSARYILQLSTLSDFSTISWSYDTSSTYLVTDSLIRATTYYWRVGAYIKGDTTANSNSNFFTTIPNLPTAPILFLPLDSSTNNGDFWIGISGGLKVSEK